MDDPVGDERENLRYDLALLSRLHASVRGDPIAVQACQEVMGERYARLEKLLRLTDGSKSERDTPLAMPERLDHVSITVDRGGQANAVRLPWSSRDHLLSKLRAIEGADGIVKAFEDVGATQPVELSTDDKALLYRVLDDRAFTSGFDQLPSGFFELRNALSDEAADAAQNE
jgi:hypothetical protein